MIAGPILPRSSSSGKGRADCLAGFGRESRDLAHAQAEELARLVAFEQIDEPMLEQFARALGQAGCVGGEVETPVDPSPIVVGRSIDRAQAAGEAPERGAALESSAFALDGGANRKPEREAEVSRAWGRVADHELTEGQAGGALEVVQVPTGDPEVTGQFLCLREPLENAVALGLREAGRE